MKTCQQTLKAKLCVPPKENCPLNSIGAVGDIIKDNSKISISNTTINFYSEKSKFGYFTNVLVSLDGHPCLNPELFPEIQGLTALQMALG